MPCHRRFLTGLAAAQGVVGRLCPVAAFGWTPAGHCPRRHPRSSPRACRQFDTIVTFINGARAPSEQRTENGNAAQLVEAVSSLHTDAQPPLDALTRLPKNLTREPPRPR